MHVIQQPTPGTSAEIEVDLLGLTAVAELSDYRFSILPLIRISDGQMGNCPVLSIDPENEIQTANFALGLSPVIAQEFFQTGGINVVWRRVRRMGRLDRDKAPVDLGNEGLRVVDSGRRREYENA